MENLMENLIERIERLVKKKLSHLDWQHTREVRVTAKELARLEGTDEKIVDLAVLLHDLGKSQAPLETHEIKSVEIIEQDEILKELDKETKEKILHCIAAHSWPWRKDGPRPATQEAKVLFDADSLEQLTPLGIVKHILMHVEKEFQEMVSLAKEDLIVAYRNLLTKSGKKMAQERIKYIEEFFGQLIKAK